MTVGEIAVRRRHARQEGSTARREMLAIYGVTEMLFAGAETVTIVNTVADQLCDVLSLAYCHFEHFEPFRDRKPRPFINQAGELEYASLDWRLETDGLPNKDVLLPVDYHGRRLGQYVLRGPNIGVPISRDRRLAAVTLSDLAGIALATAPRNHELNETSPS